MNNLNMKIKDLFKTDIIKKKMFLLYRISLKIIINSKQMMLSVTSGENIIKKILIKKKNYSNFKKNGI